MIPHRYITAEILALLEKNFDDARAIFDSEKDILVFESYEAAGGKFVGIESLLVKLEVPFERKSAEPSTIRKYRPVSDHEETIDILVNYSQGCTVIKVETIRGLLTIENPERAVALIELALNCVDPIISDLKDWVNRDRPIVSTAEVELERFSDIL